MANLSEEEIQFIREAVEHLEFPSFLTRVTNLLGKPIEKSIDLLPGQAKNLIVSTSRKAIEGAFKVALSTIKADKASTDFREALKVSEKSGRRHLAGSALSGFAGGLLGLPAMAVELPVTTTIILRSIADTAAAMGEDISRREVQLECLYLFSLGGPSKGDDEMESAYYTARVGLASLVEKAMHFIVGKSAVEIARAVQQRSAPVLVEFICKIASRFEVVVGEKAMGQFLPGIGAAGGCILNAAFSDHFNSIARYHFGLKRLERERGKAQVERIYRDILKAMP